MNEWNTEQTAWLTNCWNDWLTDRLTMEDSVAAWLGLQVGNPLEAAAMLVSNQLEIAKQQYKIWQIIMMMGFEQKKIYNRENRKP